MSSSQGSSAAQGTTALRSDSQEPSAARAVVSSINWRPIAELPDFEHRPIRQFIWIEGECDHSGLSWAREHWGIASIRREDQPGSYLGYCEEDIKRLAKEGDMHWLSVSVTHWAPASINTPRAIPPAQQAEAPASAEGTEAAQVPGEGSRDEP